MKETHYTRFFKVKFANGVRCLKSGPYDIQFHGYSRLDGYPIYKMRLPVEEVVEFSWITSSFVINRRPGYTVTKGDLELIRDANIYDEAIESSFFGEGASVDDIIPVKPLSAPTGHLYYLDYVYGNEEDERLLLML